MNETTCNEQARPVSSPLISAHQLHGLLGSPGLKIFDVRGAWGAPAFHDEYAESHIPGAVFLDWTRELLEQDIDVTLASVVQAEDARQSFRKLGIDPGDKVVVYDHYHHMLAGRIWWAMRHWGFSNVKVLNGGWGHWTAQQLPVSTEIPPSSVGSFQPVESGLRVALDDFLGQKNSSCVFDARGAAGHAGKPEDPRTGHIPGAVNVPYQSVLDPTTGLFLAADAIAEIFDRAAPNWRTTRVISSCGSGYAGTVVMLALQEAGKASRLFDGSFSVWKQDPTRPVEQS